MFRPGLGWYVMLAVGAASVPSVTSSTCMEADWEGSTDAFHSSIARNLEERAKAW